jgi:hypothetical protein
MRRSASLSIAAAAVIAVAAAHSQSSLPPDRGYGALAALPDWSGLWGHGTPLPDEWRRVPPPLKPEVAAASELGRRDGDAVLLRYCKPLQFTGSSGGFTEAVEFLFTPGRVTITNEMGLIRRIYTDGRPVPADPDPTNTGTSVGRWEGQSLIVETVGINPAALYPNTQQGAVPIGAGARISERIFLRDPNTLQFDITTVAPEVLDGPDRRTRLYTRLPKTTPTEITFCSDSDRSIDPDTGKQRFDMTPPADLPPPPR